MVLIVDFLIWPRLRYFLFPSSPASVDADLFLKLRAEENIQNLDSPTEGPSFRNSCPSPFRHLPHFTL